jgi:uracil-DNA glycosylase family 4
VRADPDLLPQALPEGWLAGTGPHKGAMVVCQWPAEGGQHFSPTEKRLLADALAAGGLEWGDLYVTGLIKMPRTSAYVWDQVAAASPYLAEEIQHVVPRFVLALGPLAFQALTGTKQELSLYRGIWYRLAEVYDWDEAVVLGTWSPAAVLEDPRKRAAQFERDAAEFARAWAAA